MPRTYAGTYAHILRNDFSAFMHRAFIELNGGGKLLDNWHIGLIAERLEQVRTGSCKRAIISVPPRHLKSFAATIAFGAWVLGHDPSKHILFMTYGQDLSDEFAQKVRTLMESPFYQSLFKTRLESRAISDLTTNEGGRFHSSSIAGGLTGRGADIIIIDDPLKAGEALSESKRKAVNDTYDNTIRSRLNNQEQGAIIIVAQRLHCDDLIAHVQENEQWDVISFAAIAEQDEYFEWKTPYGRSQFVRRAGEVLHSAHLSQSKIEELRRNMTEYNFAAQYQQDPQPQSGLIVKREWLTFYALHELPRIRMVFKLSKAGIQPARIQSLPIIASVLRGSGMENVHIFLTYSAENLLFPIY